jgi:hypothetical protein
MYGLTIELTIDVSDMLVDILSSLLECLTGYIKKTTDTGLQTIRLCE